MKELQIQKFDYQNQNQELLIKHVQVEFEEDNQNLSNEQLQYKLEHNDNDIIDNLQQMTQLKAIKIKNNQNLDNNQARGIFNQGGLQIQEEVIMQQAIQNLQNINPQSQQELLRQLFTNGSQINKTALQYISQYKQIKCFFMIFSILMQITSLALGIQLTNIIGCFMYNLNFVDQYFHESIECLIKEKRMSKFRKALTRKGLHIFKFVNKVNHLRIKNRTTTEIRKYIFVQERNFNFVIFGTLFMVSELLILREAFKVYE